MSEHDELDPYGKLEWAVGSGDDFVCFDYEVDRTKGVARLASTLNCETAHFIENFRPTVEVPFSHDLTLPYRAAEELVDAALEWCAENEVEHDTEGWNQDPMYFARCVHAAVTRSPDPVIRIAAEMEQRPLNTRNYL